MSLHEKKKTRSILINLKFKECGLLTDERLPSSFSSARIHYISNESRKIKIFLPEFTPLQ
jgi:hypothetical protein